MLSVFSDLCCTVGSRPTLSNPDAYVKSHNALSNLRKKSWAEYHHKNMNESINTAHTKPSYSDSAETIVSSRLLPSLNSAISSDPFSSLSIILNILRTRFSGVSSSAGSLTIEPTFHLVSRCMWRAKIHNEAYHLVYCFHDL